MIQIKINFCVQNQQRKEIGKNSREIGSNKTCSISPFPNDGSGGK